MNPAKLLLSLLLAALTLPALAQPGPSQIPSMEARVASADLIVAGTVTKLERVPRAEEWDRCFYVTFQPNETLKGRPPKTLRFFIRSIQRVGNIEAWAKNKTHVLIFLVSSQELASAGTVFRPSEHKTEWAYAREPYAPAFGYDENSAIELDPQGTLMQSFSYDLRPLIKPDELLAAARAAIANEPKNLRFVTAAVRVDPSMYQNRQLAGRGLTGMGLGVNFPIDARFESAARTWLKSPLPLHRLGGVESLVYFRSERNAALLRAMLSDPDAAVVNAADLVLRAWDMRADS